MKKESQLLGHHSPITSLHSIPFNKTLVSACERGSIRIYDLNTNKCIRGIQLSESVNCVISNTSNTLYACSGTDIHTIDLRQPGLIIKPPFRTYSMSKDEINQISLHSNNHFLSSADDDGLIQVIDLRTHQPFKKLKRQHSNV